MAGTFIVEHKLYCASCDSIQEANYLVAILNSWEVNAAIKPFQSTGLLGKRDIEKKVLDVPIPQFNRKKPEHRELAALSNTARVAVADFLKSTPLPKSLARRRALVRDAVSDTLHEIDDAVEDLLF